MTSSRPHVETGTRLARVPRAATAGLARAVRTRAVTVARSDRPTVSVIIPCYNYGRYLPDAVGSVLTQPGVELQVIIVDDRSSDDSLEVAQRLAADDRRIVVVAHPENRGAVETFNDGLPHVTGEFLVRLDADDLLTPGALRRATDAARAFPSAGLVYGHPVHFSGEPPVAAARTRPRTWIAWPGREWLADRCRDALNVITSPEVVMRTAVVEQVGGQNRIDHAHDMEMWLRIAAFSDVVYLTGVDQALHREHPTSLSTALSGPLDDAAERREALAVLFSGPTGQLPGAGTWHARARRALVHQSLTSAAQEFDRGRGDLGLVAECRRFALATDPAAASAPSWRRLDRRVELGQDRVDRRPWFGWSANLRRVASLGRARVWARFGTYAWQDVPWRWDRTRPRKGV